jgi:hypothetical protein
MLENLKFFAVVGFALYHARYRVQLADQIGGEMRFHYSMLKQFTQCNARALFEYSVRIFLIGDG